MITQRQLVAALTRRAVADWVVIERDQESHTIDEVAPVLRTDQHKRWTVIVRHDVPRGRGTARVEAAGADDNAQETVDQAIALAAAAIGPAWRSTPPAAPARVAVLDDALKPGTNLGEIGQRVLERLGRPAGASISCSITLVREQVSIIARSGFRTRWPASEIRAHALLGVEGRSLELDRRARRIDELGLDDALRIAARDLTAEASAGPAAPGTCVLALGPEVLLHGGELGLWSVFADQASGSFAQRGLTRYRLGTPIAPGSDQISEPLTISSDGSIDFGTRSAPVSEDGDSVRRFALVERGVATRLGLSMHQAARRGTDPNGGVRNLVVAPGTWSGTVDPNGATRILEVRRLRSLTLNRYTGMATLEVSLATDHDRRGPRTVTGGMIQLDLINALAHARRSAATLGRDGYYGPSSVLIEAAELIA